MKIQLLIFELFSVGPAMNLRYTLPLYKLPQIHKSKAHIGASNSNHHQSLKKLQGCTCSFLHLQRRKGTHPGGMATKIQQKDAPSRENHNSHKKTFNTQTVYKLYNCRPPPAADVHHHNPHLSMATPSQARQVPISATVQLRNPCFRMAIPNSVLRSPTSFLVHR